MCTWWQLEALLGWHRARALLSFGGLGAFCFVCFHTHWTYVWNCMDGRDVDLMAGHVFAENRSVECYYGRLLKNHQSRGAHFRVLQNASSPEFLTCSVSGTCWVDWYGEEPPASCVWDLRGPKEMDRSWVVCELAFAMKVFFGNFNLLFCQHGFEISRKTNHGNLKGFSKILHDFAEGQMSTTYIASQSVTWVTFHFARALRHGRNSNPKGLEEMWVLVASFSTRGRPRTNSFAPQNIRKGRVELIFPKIWGQFQVLNFLKFFSPRGDLNLLQSTEWTKATRWADDRSRQLGSCLSWSVLKTLDGHLTTVTFLRRLSVVVQLPKAHTWGPFFQIFCSDITAVLLCLSYRMKQFHLRFPHFFDRGV